VLPAAAHDNEDELPRPLPMPTKTFAFIHAITPERLQPFQAVAPDVEFLIPGEAPLPAGLERADAAAISWGGPPIDDILAAAPRLRWLHQRGAGIDRIATPRLVDSDVVVTNGSGNHAPNIAEHLLALMLAFARQLPALIRSQQNACGSRPASSRLFELSGQTLAIVGAGAIGSALAPRAAALGMTVIGVRRSAAAAPPAGIDRIVTIDRIDEALGVADHVAIALPLTAETRGLFSAALIAKMKPGAYLYKRRPRGDRRSGGAARCASQRPSGGAGLDVTEPEPLPADSPLWREPSVVITAHSSGNTPRSYERYERLCSTTSALGARRSAAQRGRQAARY
jgi:phosphoglycerate dehydrogenase-like enzyme